jgi:hypothetical protein
MQAFMLTRCLHMQHDNSSMLAACITSGSMQDWELTFQAKAVQGCWLHGLVRRLGGGCPKTAMHWLSTTVVPARTHDTM